MRFMLGIVAAGGLFSVFIQSSDGGDISDQTKIGEISNKSWLGGVTLKILHLSHYLRGTVEERVGRIITHYIKSIDPSWLVFADADVERLSSQWKGKIQEDVESGNFELAKIISDEGADRFGVLLENLAPILEEENKDGGPFSIFDRDAPRGTSSAARRMFVKGSYSRGWGPDEFRDALRDYRERIVAMDKERRVSLFLDAVAKSFDQNSAYYPSERHRYIVAKVSLKPTGVGIELTGDGSGRVSQVLPNSPAGRSGEVKEGDRVISVTDKEGMLHTSRTSIDQFGELLAAEPGEPVTIEFERSDESVSKITLRGEQLKVSDEKRVSGNIAEKGGLRIGVLKIPSFYSGSKGEDPNAEADTKKKILDMLREGVDAIVVDVRQDAGGAAEAARAVSSLFFKGPVYYSLDRNGMIRAENTRGKTVYDGPLVVLVSAGTASSAEIFARAVQDHGRGIVVGGHRTFGKGSLQNLLDLDWHGGHEHFPDGGAGSVRVTTHILFGPNGQGIQGRGVSPDIVVPCPYDIAFEVSSREGRAEAPMMPYEIDTIGRAPTELARLKPVLLRKSAERVGRSPYFLDVSRLKRDFEALFDRPLFGAKIDEYAQAMAPFSKLSGLIKSGPRKTKSPEAMGEPEADPVLDEAVSVAADLTNLTKDTGSGPAPARSKIEN